MTLAKYVSLISKKYIQGEVKLRISHAQEALKNELAQIMPQFNVRVTSSFFESKVRKKRTLKIIVNLAFVHLKRWNTVERGHCVLDLVLRGHISGNGKYSYKDANILVVFVPPIDSKKSFQGTFFV